MCAASWIAGSVVEADGRCIVSVEVGPIHNRVKVPNHRMSSRGVTAVTRMDGISGIHTQDTRRDADENETKHDAIPRGQKDLVVSDKSSLSLSCSLSLSLSLSFFSLSVSLSLSLSQVSKCQSEILGFFTACVGIH